LKNPLGDRWRDIDRIFSHALEMDVGDRAAYVHKTCGGDSDLREAVEELLDASEELGSFLETPVGGIATEVWQEFTKSIDDPAGNRIGQRVGKYRLVGEISRGGMGAVYLAERDDDQFERQVAVKILRSGMSTEEVVAHFLRERQILASLNHKNIAQLIDGGATDDGRPYLVMEYVPGTQIDEYCDALKLPVEERLRVFLDVVEAVEYAHRQLVVHRDLKPSNILVTDEGKVKLLDFGIAKILEETDAGEGNPITRPGARLMTPEYAAPEQILGERVRTETDVYALSAVLYELLTGVRPYAGEGRASVLDRVISGALPTRPSEAVREGGSDESRHSPPQDPDPLRFECRKTTPEGLAKALAGDLDAILLRGLRSRPEDRYGSVSHLREELESYLAGYPVRARGEARLYRARRFVSRHRSPVAAAAAFMVLMAGGGVGLAMQRTRVIEERDRAEEAAELAAQEALTARRVTEFLVEIFEGSDPAEQLGDTVTARFLLARGAERIDQELNDQPEVRATLLEALGTVYQSLGSFEEAKRLLENAVALRRAGPVVDAGSLAHSLGLLGEHFRNATSPELAVPLFKEALELIEGDDEELSRLGDLHVGLGNTYLMLREVDSAEVHLRSGLDGIAKTRSESDPFYRSALVGLAGLLREKGNYDESEATYLEVLEKLRTAEENHPLDIAVTLNNLGFLRRTQGDDVGAGDYYRQALAVQAGAYGRGHPNSLMVAGNLASALERVGEGEEALLVFWESVGAAEEQWPEGHWRLAQLYMQVGGVLLNLGRAQEALHPLWNAVTMAIATQGDDHAWTRIYLGWYGAALALSGQEEEAAGRFEQSLLSLGAYDQLRDDRQSLGRLRALIDHLDRFGLTDESARYRALIEG